MVYKPLALLHIGVEKTGSTTIQEFLYQNKILLKRQGVFFPELITFRNHRPVAVYCCKTTKSNMFTNIHGIDDLRKREKWKLYFWNLFASEMKKIDKGVEKVIFSSEHFSSLLKDKEEIQLLKLFMEPYFSMVKIVIYIRRQDLIAGSMISNSAKAGSGKMMPKADQISHRHYYNFNKLVRKWSDIFGKGNLRLRVFEADRMTGKDLLTDFKQQVGIYPDKGFIEPGRLNTSISATAVETAWLFNKKYPLDKYKGDLNELRKIRLKLINQVNKNYPGPGIMFNRKDAKKFLKQYKRSNSQLAKTWFNRRKIFSEDFSMYPKNKEKVDTGLVLTLVKDFITREGLQKKLITNE